MNRKIVCVVICATVIAISIFSCPKKREHQQVISDELKEIVNEGIASRAGLSMANLLSNSLMPIVADALVANSLIYKNYYVASAGYVSANGKSQIVSFGFFGHVFLLGEDRLKDAIFGYSDKYIGSGDENNKFNNIEKEQEDYQRSGTDDF